MGRTCQKFMGLLRKFLKMDIQIYFILVVPTLSGLQGTLSPPCSLLWARTSLKIEVVIFQLSEITSALWKLERYYTLEQCNVINPKLAHIISLIKQRISCL